MSEPVQAKLLRRLERYIKRNKIPHTVFAKAATGDHQSVGRLRRGISTVRTMNKIQAYLDKVEDRR